MSYSFKQLAEDVLEKTGKAMNAADIWNIALEMNLAQRLGTVGKTPIATLGAQIYTDIKNKRDKSKFKKVGRGVFALNDGNNYTELEIFSNKESFKQEKVSYKEKDMHKLLVTFVANAENFHCSCKTIDEKHSKKGEKGEREWLHPDIVGVYYSKEDYKDKVVDLMGKFGYSGAKLFSFELKQKLDMGTLRQYFFQAVSNSSWANEGYLVVLNIAEEENFRVELKRLCNAFGIGVIKLIPENIYQSEIIYPAVSRDFVDWETLNTLYDANSDFEKFVDDVVKSISINDEHGTYDDIFNSEDEAREYAKEKGMIK
ncbi:MAG: HTH domain-containing protein [Acidaminococcaceae bacterium]|nr:HTH domain-containing protein [Acidaminococcaceae bacterium]